ncbi:MAG TPA: asparagine synthase-related protein [Trebonia sp.]|nr:asparagine synthase-related protein [Trebonia sp.]
MFFTLAVSASSPRLCAELADRARVADPAVMPIPGPAVVAWRSPDGRAALLHWGERPGGGELPARGEPGLGVDEPGLSEAGLGKAGREGARAASHAGTIWAESPTPGSGRAPVVARTSVTRVDPVYVAEVPGAVVVADRATWAAWTASRLDAHDPLHVAALLNPGFPLGSATPFDGVSAVTASTTLHLLNGALTRLPAPARAARAVAGASDHGGARAVAEGLVAAVAHLADAGQPVELSLTGGKDSRLIAAALVTAGVPVVARTHGFADHPDVVVAAEIARRLGIEHLVKTPAAPGQQVDVLGRIRATVLVADGMLSAFENVGRPDPAASAVITAGGHGGELLRGGYAETAAGRPGPAGGVRAALGPARRAARSTELLRRLTSKHLGLIRHGPAAGYVASLAPWTAALARSPLHALDDFYLANRAGRWSAAARQAYLIREHLVQPLFDDRVVLAARAVPLADRINGGLSAAVLAELSPALVDVPLAGKPPAPKPAVDGSGGGQAPFDWRRQYGEAVASLLRDYTLDLGAPAGLFAVVNRAAAEKVLTAPRTDPGTVWALATLACLLSGDYRHARNPAQLVSVS